MMKYQEGNLFDHIKDTVVIPHLCNNEGVWGRGFVIPLTQRYPEAKASYERLFADDSKPSLGYVDFVRSGDVVVANMIAQVIDLESPQDMEWMGIRPVRYNALVKCMDQVADWIQDNLRHAKIYCPLFGARLAGGNWLYIKELIRDCWEDRGISVTVFYLPKFPPPDLFAKKAPR
jgi:hypothetical protein